MSFNPLLTYTVRLKKIYVKPNFTMDYYTIDLYKDTQYLNGQITINSNKLINKVVGLIYRCDSEGINCEYFQTWILPDICTKLKDKNQVWSRWYD
ncbi:uncharacterized protein LOC132919326 [Rhopalosiphum padi]|uniref:uncharacterized protein LOC132919326 n=1 Tax=Rhopalosiphum padi TaxID=40932 RepID=UPI00298D90CC|nr:uncharacterized protein LOC132919326 [Rhopalosiphum padi]